MDWIVDLLLWLLWAVAVGLEGLRQAVGQLFAASVTAAVQVAGAVLEDVTTRLLWVGAAVLLLAVVVSMACVRRFAARRRNAGQPGR